MTKFKGRQANAWRFLMILYVSSYIIVFCPEPTGVKKMKNDRQSQSRIIARIVYFSAIILSTLFIIVGNRIVMASYPDYGEDMELYTAKVERIVSREDLGDLTGDGNYIKIEFEGVFLDGPYKGSSVAASQTIAPYYHIDMKEVENGDKIILYKLELEGEASQWLFQEYSRTSPIIFLGVMFLLSLLVFGRFKGLNTVLALGFTCLVIFLIFIPGVLAGFNIYALTFIVAAFSIIVTLVLVSGINAKSISAAIGCFVSLCLCSVLILLTDVFLKLSGYMSSDSSMLSMWVVPIDLKAIIFSSIIIGALGAVMDVGISIASSLQEIHEAAPDVGFRALMKAAFNIGRDMMGTMSNTLVLAYIGCGMASALLLIANSHSALELFNYEPIVVEILQALIGSFSLLFAIPLTALVMSLFMTKKRSAKNLEKAQLQETPLPAQTEGGQEPSLPSMNNKV